MPKQRKQNAMSENQEDCGSFEEPANDKIAEDVELYSEFISESCEHLLDTEANILSLEDNPKDLEILNSIFRCVHSIKGSAGFLGLEKIQKLSHELETILDKARKSELDITPSITDVLLNSIDTLGKLIDTLAIKVTEVTGSECERIGKDVSGESIDISSELKDIGNILSGEGGSEKDEVPKPAENVVEEPKSSEDILPLDDEPAAKETEEVELYAEDEKGAAAEAAQEGPLSFYEPSEEKMIEDLGLYKEFISESIEHLQDIETNILSLEDSPKDQEILNTIFRCVHSIKGSTGCLGLEKIQKLSHELETILDKARKYELDITPAITDTLLKSKDTLGKLIDAVSIKVSAASGTECERIGTANPGEVIDIGPDLSDIYKILSPEKAAAAGPKPETNDIFPLDDDFETDNQGGKIGDLLVKSGVVSKEQVDEAVAIKSKKIGEILVEKGVATEEEVADAAREKDKKIGEILVEKGATTPKKVEEVVKKQAAIRKDTAKTTLKVDTTKLDSLFDLVGELVVTHSLINEEFISLQNQNQNSGTNRNLSQLGKIVKDLQDQTMSLRMVPLKQTFQKMTRLVRDVSSGAGKDVKLDISGEDTELDKNVIEKVADPLVHILRNAVDHGVESTEDRVKANKSKTGHVHLDAFHRGGNIVIKITDDGKGLSKDRILKKGIEKGIVSDASSLTDEQIYNLIFAPGFSTAEKITNISGRGVGMDVVKRNIDNLQGKVEITSEEGKGSVFTIRLPLTLAIIDGIVIKVGTTRYIVPIISVEESLQPEKEMFSTIRKKEEILNIRGEVIPLVRLHKILNLPATHQNPWDAIVVIVQTENFKLGLMADDIVGQQQVVIKSLGKRFVNSKGISGGAIMGNGEVGLIMDINGIKELAAEQ